MTSCACAKYKPYKQKLFQKLLSLVNMATLRDLLSSIIGDGFESTLSVLTDEQIDLESFLLLDKPTLQELSEFCSLVTYFVFSLFSVLGLTFFATSW